MHARSVGCIAAALMAVGMADCRAETLVEALAAAYGSNSNLAAARARLRAADEGVSQAVATWRPTVTITGGAGRQMVTSPANAALFGYHSYMSNQSATYSLVQPLYQGGLTTASVEQAENSVRAQRANLRATEATVLLTAATAFFDVVRDRAILKVNIENEQNLREQAAASHERFREAEISSTSVAQSEARLSQASAQRALAETALADSQANFAAVIGHFPEALEVPTEADAFPQTLDTVKAAALAENPNLVAARYAYDAAKAGVDVAFSSLLPQVSLTAQRIKNWNAAYVGSYTGVDQVLLGVTVPIYQNGAEYSRVRAQKEVAAQRRLETDQARVDAVQSAGKAWNYLDRARRTEAFYLQQVAHNIEAVDGVQEEEQIGSRTVIEVLNAKQELVTARVNLIQARHDLWLASFQLRSVMGNLTAEALALPVAVYDPAAHYEDVRGKMFGTGDTPLE